MIRMRVEGSQSQFAAAMLNAGASAYPPQPPMPPSFGKHCHQSLAVIGNEVYSVLVSVSTAWDVIVVRNLRLPAAVLKLPSCCQPSDISLYIPL